MKINYYRYHFSLKELLLYSFLGLSLDAIVSYLFYRSIIAFILFLPAVIFFINKQNQLLAKKQRKDLTYQFREAILSVSSSLSAGYSIENAFIEALNDLNNLYNKDSIIIKEFLNISGRLASNDTLESILQDFATRSGIEDIQDFTDVFITAKRSGGDLVSIIRKTTDHIGEKIEVLREIDTIMSSKKMEQNIMSSIPFIIIFYLNFNSSDFLSILYGNLTGVIIMTICLLLYFIAFSMAQKIVAIEV